MADEADVGGVVGGNPPRERSRLRCAGLEKELRVLVVITFHGERERRRAPGIYVRPSRKQAAHHARKACVRIRLGASYPRCAAQGSEAIVVLEVEILEG